MRNTCPTDSEHKTIRIDRYDTFACPICMIWTEKRHTPESCPDCPYEYPPEILTQDILKEQELRAQEMEALRNVARIKNKPLRIKNKPNS